MIEDGEPIRMRKDPPPSTDAMDRVDMALSATGVALAVFAAFFPWYVFFNYDQFAPKYGEMVQNMRRDLPVFAPKPVFSVSPSASININQRPPALAMQVPPGLDDITTATVPGEDADRKRPRADPGSLDQPMPAAANSFRLLHVAGGRALVEDGRGVYMVGIGEFLPDNSKLVSIERQGEQWLLTTSNGNTLRVN
ncbi:MAG TPA: hypothetical protein VN112_05150 [Ensifer sp.]|nr:hypothetical protein [Ensifer sp.]